MDYRTLLIFDVVTLAVYATAMCVLAVRNRRRPALIWFAGSVVLQLVQTMLQALRGSLPQSMTALLPTILSGVAFFAMYMGFRWTLVQRPLKTWIGPVLLYMALTAYAGLYLLHAPFDFAVGMSPVFVCAGLSAGMLMRRGRRPLRTVSRVSFVVLVATMGLIIYRTVVMVGSYNYSRADGVVADPRMVFSLLGLMALGGCMVLMYMWFFVAERWNDLAQTARLDPLTGVLNRRAIEEVARREVSRARRSGEPLTLMLLDIDFFKKINDVHGHRAGDQALRTLVEVLQAELRQIDLLGRLGGEEFVIFLPGTTAVNASLLAERLRASVEAVEVVFEGRTLRITITAGLTQWLPHEANWDGMLERADEAMYKGKKSGRNRVELDSRPTSVHVLPLMGARRGELAARRQEKAKQMAG